MRLIDAEALKEIIKERRTNIEKDHGIEVGFAIGMLIACETIIDKQPTIEAKPVVHAHWVTDFDFDPEEEQELYFYFCSNCKDSLFGDKEDFKYCPYCGAQMDEEVSE